MGGSMRNILLWAGIAVLAFQDSFKKKPVKPTRQQQFFQTGGTSQAFIEGVGGTYSSIKKILTKYFGKPDISFRGESIWSKKIKIILVAKANGLTVATIGTKFQVFFSKYMWQEEVDTAISEMFEAVFLYQSIMTQNDEYDKLKEIAAAGDWELALQIAKGQGLL